MILFALATVVVSAFDEMHRLEVQLLECRTFIIGELGMQHVSADDAEKTAGVACKRQADSLTGTRDSYFRQHKSEIQKIYPQFDPKLVAYWDAYESLVKARITLAKGH